MNDIIKQALQNPACERLRDFYEVGPVQRAAVESFADALCGWKPIGTAPKDGTRIWLNSASGTQAAQWDEDAFESGWLIGTYPDGDVNRRSMVHEPTRWMHLPPNPVD